MLLEGLLLQMMQIYLTNRTALWKEVLTQLSKRFEKMYNVIVESTEIDSSSSSFSD